MRSPLPQHSIELAHARRPFGACPGQLVPALQALLGLAQRPELPIQLPRLRLQLLCALRGLLESGPDFDCSVRRVVGARPGPRRRRKDRVQLGLEILHLRGHALARLGLLLRLGARLDQPVHRCLALALARRRHFQHRQDQVHSVLVVPGAPKRRLQSLRCLGDPLARSLGPADELDSLQRPVMTEHGIDAPVRKPPAPLVALGRESRSRSLQRFPGSIQIRSGPFARAFSVFKIPRRAGKSVPVHQILPGTLHLPGQLGLIYSRGLRVRPGPCTRVLILLRPRKLCLGSLQLLHGPSIRRGQLFLLRTSFA